LGAWNIPMGIAHLVSIRAEKLFNYDDFRKAISAVRAVPYVIGIVGWKAGLEDFFLEYGQCWCSRP
jgi:uncharacterized membrane protein